LGCGTYIFGEEVTFAVVIDIYAGITALKTEWPLASYVGILATYAITCCDADLGFPVVGAVDMHPKHVFVRLLVEHDLGPLDDTVWTSIA
jgi:hypothetical protein